MTVIPLDGDSWQVRGRSPGELFLPYLVAVIGPDDAVRPVPVTRRLDDPDGGFVTEGEAHGFHVRQAPPAPGPAPFPVATRTAGASGVRHLPAGCGPSLVHRRAPGRARPDRTR
ncbi:MAG TPA: hypothetical protein VHJ83_11900 [Micromonosporaceae bacterium]|nr:hypothetical protein [Micromonosporaceae bacterium]